MNRPVLWALPVFALIVAAYCLGRFGQTGEATSVPRTSHDDRARLAAPREYRSATKPRSDLSNRGRTERGNADEEIREAAARQTYELEKEKRQLEIQINTLFRMQGEELTKYAASLSEPNSALPSHYERYQAAHLDLQALEAVDIEPNDLRVTRAKLAIENIEGDVKDSVGVLQEILQTQLELIDGQLERLNEFR